MTNAWFAYRILRLLSAKNTPSFMMDSRVRERASLSPCDASPH